MRFLHLQHVPFEGLGSIETWLQSAGHTVTHGRMFQDKPLPDVRDIDGLIVMGGPMGANDDDLLPWMSPEKAYIRQAIDAGKPVLGVCLGSQLIAAVLGARVYKNEKREVGWFPIHRVPQAHDHPIGSLFPERLDVFHWHGDTFDLPPGAIRLMSSEGCRNQSYAVGERILAFQFHLEMTPSLARALIIECAADLQPDLYVQPAALIASDENRFQKTNQLMASILQRFFG